MWEIIKVLEFDAAHHLPEYDGKCAGVHGHRWKVTIKLSVDELDKQGIGVDFIKIKHLIKDMYDHQDLNLLLDNPTAENLAKKIFDDVMETFPSVEIYEVWVEESPGSIVKYYGKND